MPPTERKTISIVLEECKAIQERCGGYRAALTDAVADILAAERQHRVQGTNIVQKVSDKCNALGEFLAAQQAAAQGSDGEPQ